MTDRTSTIYITLFASGEFYCILLFSDMHRLSGNYCARSLLLQINKFPSANCVHLIGFSSHGTAHRRNTSLKSCSVIQIELGLCLSLTHLDSSRINKQHMCSLVGGELKRNSKLLGFFPYSRLQIILECHFFSLCFSYCIKSYPDNKLSESQLTCVHTSCSHSLHYKQGFKLLELKSKSFLFCRALHSDS